VEWLADLDDIHVGPSLKKLVSKTRVWFCESAKE
jgi:hypothetical protein